MSTSTPTTTPAPRTPPTMPTAPAMMPAIATGNASMPPGLPADAPAQGGVAERIVGVVHGDRACHACGFDLRGQPILREPHYAMLLLRCPECGCVGPVTEYPLASSFAKRLGRLLAIAWLLGVIALYLIIAIMAAGLSNSAAASALEPVAFSIAEQFIAHAKEEVAKNPNAATTANMNWVVWAASQAPSSAVWIDPVWWRTQTDRFWVDEALALHRPLSMKHLSHWLRSYAVMIPAGMVLACIFPHRRRLELCIIVLCVVPLGALMAWGFSGQPAMNWGAFGGGAITAAGAAQEVVGQFATLLQLAIVAPALILGALVGRPVARWVVVWLLPPRLRVAYAFLWIADNKPLPRPERVRFAGSDAATGDKTGAGS